MKKLLTLVAVLLTFAVSAQNLKTPAASPTQTMKQDFALSSIEIKYSRPAMKGRAIFGDLVPFDKVWRTGANEANEITFYKDMYLGKTKIKAGSYSLFTIPETENITVLAPAASAVIEGSSVRLEWESVPNATHYIVQVNPFNIFSIIFNEFLVDEPALTFNNLLPNETFFWRIFPFNAYYTCGSFTRPAQFNTNANITSTNELLTGEQFTLLPNPSSNGQVRVELVCKQAGVASWQLLNLHGQTLQSAQFHASSGLQQIPINTSQLPAGIYLVRLNIDQRMAIKKLIIN